MAVSVRKIVLREVDGKPRLTIQEGETVIVFESNDIKISQGATGVVVKAEMPCAVFEDVDIDG